MDIYLSKYILEYLHICKECNRYCIYNTNTTCIICNECYCETCKHYFYKIVGFYENKYCRDCANMIML